MNKKYFDLTYNFVDNGFDKGIRKLFNKKYESYLESVVINGKEHPVNYRYQLPLGKYSVRLIFKKEVEPKSLKGFFYDTDLVTINDTNIDFSKVNNMNGMFCFCKQFQLSDCMSSWNVSNVKNMSYLFERCMSLANLDALKYWDVSNVRDMRFIFSSCKSLANLDALQNWDVSNVRIMSNMFSYCKSLANLDALQNWDVSNVKNMCAMFSVCDSLTNFDALQYWDVSNVVYMTAMFSSCKSLTNHDALQYWDVSNVDDMRSMFYNCKSLKSIDVNFDVSFIELTYNIKESGLNCLFDSSYNDLISAVVIDDNKVNVSNIHELDSGIHKVKIRFKNNEISSLKNFFAGTDLKSVDRGNLSRCFIIDTSSMFKDCKQLEHCIGLQNFNVSQVEDMSEMFCNCSSLKNLNGLQKWNVSNVENMCRMFADSSSLQLIDALKDWDISNVEIISDMFSGCTGLNKIDAIKNWYVFNIEEAQGVFDGCDVSFSEDSLRTLAVRPNNLIDYLKDSLPESIIKANENIKTVLKREEELRKQEEELRKQAELKRQKKDERRAKAREFYNNIKAAESQSHKKGRITKV